MQRLAKQHWVVDLTNRSFRYSQKLNIIGLQNAGLADCLNQLKRTPAAQRWQDCIRMILLDRGNNIFNRQ